MTLTYRDLFNSVGALQLLSRAPEASPVYLKILGLGQRFQRLLSVRHPEGKPLLDMGWDSRNDR